MKKESKNHHVNVCVCTRGSALSHVWVFVTPWTIAHQAHVCMEFFRQEYWSGLPFPTPRVLPKPGIKPAPLASPALAGRFFTISATWTLPLLVPWTARRSNQSTLKEISPEYSLEGLMLKLKLQYFGHLMRRTGSLEKTLMLGRSEGRRRGGRQRMRWLDGLTNPKDMSFSKLQELVILFIFQSVRILKCTS